MFSVDRWQEVLSTLGRNPLRSILAAICIAWGMFMLVTLLGMGRGLRHGAEKQFADDAANSVWMWAGATSMPHDGMPVNRRIIFDNEGYAAVRRVEGVDKLTGRFHASGELRVRVGAKVQTFDVRAVHPDHLFLERTIMTAGRYLNEIDVTEKRKVTSIGVPVAEFLWGHTDVIGRTLEINGITFTVVGLFTDEGGPEEQRKLYIPITAAQLAFNGGDRINALMFTVGGASVAETQKLIDKVTAVLAERENFAPGDPQAVRVRNNLEQFAQFQEIFLILEIIVAAMGALALVIGIVLVWNIMMISVKERTREIGIRKALGAPPLTIVGTILQESLFLTIVSGYLGLVGGVAILELIGSLAEGSSFGDFFASPEVNFTIALIANGVLVLSGALAGFFPALAAARVSPVVAMRDE